MGSSGRLMKFHMLWKGRGEDASVGDGWRERYHAEKFTYRTIGFPVSPSHPPHLPGCLAEVPKEYPHLSLSRRYCSRRTWKSQRDTTVSFLLLKSSIPALYCNWFFKLLLFSKHGEHKASCKYKCGKAAFSQKNLTGFFNDFKMSLLMISTHLPGF